MSKSTKLQEMLAEALDREPDSLLVMEVIDTMAEWFELLLEDMGIEPASIPSLLRWQYLHSDYANKQAIGIEND
jgi:predicted ATP-dependent Lon-type protease